ncbi:MAG: hypothetical protein KAH84_01945 [Thiomargarita sp.]|nr:hypothetical protein [Thiomargarita sp.]
MNRNILPLICLLIIPFGCNDSETGQVIDAQVAVNNFIIDVNPDLYKTMSTMKKEIQLADQKLNQLYDLKGMFPDQRDMISNSIKQWRTLRKQLKTTLNNIHDKVEAAYVAYKIDEIQGRKKFGQTSQNLLKEGQSVLAEAEVIKSTIEKELYE